MGLPDTNLLLPLLIAFTFGITFHEFAHAYVADQMGDTLPRQQGRVTLNPLKHMDPFGTLLIFLIGFGWGKPVMHRTHDRKRRLWISLAGPLSNLIQAVVFGLLLRFLPQETLNIGPSWLNLLIVLRLLVSINILLAVFNMIPLSPLDGSSVLAGILPERYAYRLMEYNARYPQALFFFLIADFFLGRVAGFSILGTVLSPIISAISGLILG